MMLFRTLRPNRIFEQLESRHLLTNTVGLTIDAVDVGESDGSLVVTVLRVGDVTERATVDVATRPGTAEGEIDFREYRGVLEFQPGVSGQQIQIDIVDNDAVEPTESFEIELSNPIGTNLGVSRQSVAIHDNDSPTGPLFFDDFEGVSKWAINRQQGDTARRGSWEAGAPQPSQWRGFPMQLAALAPGQRNLATGLASLDSVVANDLDGGSTTATSPQITLPADEFIELSFNYTLSHDETSSADDFLYISVLTADGEQHRVFQAVGEPTWRPGEWLQRSVELSSFAGQAIYIEIEAADGGAENLFEAAIDNVTIDIIPDEPGVLEFRDAQVYVQENGTPQLEIMRRRGHAGTVSVEVVSISGDAVGGEDYVDEQITLEFDDGEISKRIDVSLIDDQRQEPTESFFLELRNPTDGASLGLNVRTKINVADDDRFLLGALPDLMPLSDGPQETGIIDTAERAGRVLFRFETQVANIGDGPLEVWGGNPTGGTQEVFQRVYQVDGTTYDRLAGHFVFHAEHGHVHLEGFSTFSIRSLDDEGRIGDIVASGGKTSFCLINVAHPFPDLSDLATRRDGRGGQVCGSVQGISVGHADVYGNALSGQWIDVTDLADGEYILEIVVDPDDDLLELNESNNVLQRRVVIDNPFFDDGRWTTPPFERDDHANSPFDSPTWLEPAGELTAELQSREDTDWFQFEAEADQLYIASVTSTELDDLSLRLYDEDGTPEIAGEEATPKIEWVAPRDGEFFWEVRSESSVGEYTLEHRRVDDDHGNLPDAATSISPNSTTAGELAFHDDIDWFRMDVTPGQAYEFATQLLSLPDSNLDLFAEDGSRLLAANNDFELNLHSKFIWQAVDEEAVFLRVGPGDQSETASGTYQLVIRTLATLTDDHPGVRSGSLHDLNVRHSGRLDFAGDRDVFEFEVDVEQSYLFELRSTETDIDVFAGSEHQPQLQISHTSRHTSTIWELVPPHDESLALTLSSPHGETGTYELLALLEEPDDFSSSTAEVLPVSRKNHLLHDEFDEDHFRFFAEHGATYRVQVSPADGSDIDPYVQLQSMNGLSLASNDDASPFTVASELAWTAGRSEEVAIVVTSRAGRIGNYDLVIEQLVSTEHEHPGADDFPNSASVDAPRIPLFSVTNGRIDYQHDEDWTQFHTARSQPITVRLSPQHNSPLQGAALRIHSEEGELLHELGGSKDQQELRIDFQSEPDSTYFVQFLNPTKGSYSIELDSDDFADVLSLATPIDGTEVIHGTIEHPDDTDWFRFTAVTGNIYWLEVHLDSINGLPLSDSFLNAFNEAGDLVAMDDDGGDGLGSRLRWKALQNETVYVEVSGVRTAIGDYRFLLTESSDDHGNNASTATGIELGSIVEGVFDSDIDIDWFRFAAPASGVYRAAVDHGALIITTSPDGQSLKPPSPVASLEAMAGEEVYVRVDGAHAAKRPYALTLHSLVDEHGDSVDDATAMIPNEIVHADLQTDNDRDWFSLNLVEGQQYFFETSTESGNARITLFDQQGAPANSVPAERLFWRPTTASGGRHFLELTGDAGPTQLVARTIETTEMTLPLHISAAPTSTVWYELDAKAGDVFRINRPAESVPQPPIRLFLNDRLLDTTVASATYYVDEPSTLRLEVQAASALSNYELILDRVAPTHLEVPSLVEQHIEVNGGSDFFVLPATPGMIYTTHVLGGISGYKVIREDHVLPQLPNGKVTWFSPVAERVLIEVASDREDSDYQLRIEASVPDNLIIGGIINANLRNDDVHWYQLHTTNGTRYRFETSLISLHDSVLELFDSSGQRIEFNDDTQGLASRIDWTAEKAELIYLRVSGLLKGGGVYEIRVDDISPIPKPALAGDINSDGKLNAVDIDRLFGVIRENSYSDQLDLNHDGQIDQHDIDALFIAAFGSPLRTDFNLDGLVEFEDFLILSNHYGLAGSWEQGDVTGDGIIGFEDFLILSSDFASPTAAPSLQIAMT